MVRCHSNKRLPRGSRLLTLLLFEGRLSPNRVLYPEPHRVEFRRVAAFLELYAPGNRNNPVVVGDFLDVLFDVLAQRGGVPTKHVTANGVLVADMAGIGASAAPEWLASACGEPAG